MTFQDQTFAKGFVNNGVLVGLVRYFTPEGQLMNITNISTSNNITRTSARKWNFGPVFWHSFGLVTS